MARVDICNSDISGVYVDGKWMDVDSIDVNLYDQEPTMVYELGRRDPVVIEPGRRVYTVHLDLASNGPRLTMKIEDAEVHFWKNRDEYRAQNEMYVIEEMTP